MKVKSTKLNYEVIHQICQKIVDKIKDDGLHVNRICAIGRGGMIPSTILAHMLNVEDVDYFKCSRKHGYNGSTLKPIFDHTDLKTTLFVDDMIETGSTFKLLDNAGIIKSSNGMTVALIASENSEGFYYSPDYVGYTASLEDVQNIKMPWEK